MSVMNGFGIPGSTVQESVEDTGDNRFVLESMFTEGVEDLDLETQDYLFEQFLIDEVNCMTEAERKEFLDSDLCEALVEAGRMRKNTIVFLSGKDDLARRTKMSSLSLAKQHHDPLFEKIRALRVKERKYLSAIMKKYGRKGNKIAKKSQKDWIRNRMPSNFGKFGGSDRVSASASAGNGPKKHGDGLVW